MHCGYVYIYIIFNIYLSSSAHPSLLQPSVLTYLNISILRETSDVFKSARACIHTHTHTHIYIYIYIKVKDPVTGPVWSRGWVEV